MSIFASQTQSDPIPVPFDPPHTVTVRKLTGREVEAAQTEHMKSLVAGRSARGWSAAFHRLIAGVATPADAQKALADPLEGYDRTALVRAGLVAWSYALPIRRIETTATDTTTVTVVDAVEDLVDEALEFIAGEVLRLTKPALFLTPALAEDDQKKD